MSEQDDKGLSEWLVEIVLKNHEVPLKGGNRLIGYEEVLAETEAQADSNAYQQFCNRSVYEPILRRQLQQYGITSFNCQTGEVIKMS